MLEYMYYIIYGFVYGPYAHQALQTSVFDKCLLLILMINVVSKQDCCEKIDNHSKNHTLRKGICLRDRNTNECIRSKKKIANFIVIISTLKWNNVF